MENTSLSNNKSINSIGFIKDIAATIIYDYSTKLFEQLKYK